MNIEGNTTLPLHSSVPEQNSPTPSGRASRQGMQGEQTIDQVTSRFHSSTPDIFLACPTKKEQQMLPDLIVAQDWEALRHLLLSQCRDEFVLPQANPADSALHLACRSHPPLDVIILLAQLYPKAVVRADNMGRFPLHLAARWGCSPKVIKFLVAKNPPSAGLQDTLGKTPLHLVCEHYGSTYNASKEGVPLKDSILEVAKTLCRLAPESVNLEDSEGMSALEYAIDSDADIKLIKGLQKACEKDWKRRRADGEKHSDAEKELKEESHERKAELSQLIFELNLSARKLPIDREGEVAVRPTPSNKAKPGSRERRKAARMA